MEDLLKQSVLNPSALFKVNSVEGSAIVIILDKLRKPW